jgi:glycerol uptake facilitator protein
LTRAALAATISATNPGAIPMNPYIAELAGTCLLVLLGNGVVANVVLERTKGQRSGWIVITVGWGLAVFVAVVCTAEASGAHINPAVTLGVALAGKFDWALVPGYVAAQMAGGFFGAALVWLFYRQHYRITPESGAKLATFCTSPAIRSAGSALFCEVIGTFVLVFTVLLAAGASFTASDGSSGGTIGLGALGALPVALLVCAIGLSLGGTTGYAINPARDLPPRLAHAILPIRGKGSSDWAYSWVPVLGPLMGGALAASVYLLIARQALEPLSG